MISVSIMSVVGLLKYDRAGSGSVRTSKCELCSTSNRIMSYMSGTFVKSNLMHGCTWDAALEDSKN